MHSYECPFGLRSNGLLVTISFSVLDRMEQPIERSQVPHEKMGFSPGYSLATTRHSGAARISVVVLFVCHSRRESAVAFLCGIAATNLPLSHNPEGPAFSRAKKCSAVRRFRSAEGQNLHLICV